MKKLLTALTVTVALLSMGSLHAEDQKPATSENGGGCHGGGCHGGKDGSCDKGDKNPAPSPAPSPAQ